MKSNAIEVTNRKMDILEVMTFLNKLNTRRLLKLIEDGEITQTNLVKIVSHINRINIGVYELTAVKEGEIESIDKLIEITRRYQTEVDEMFGD